MIKALHGCGTILFPLYESGLWAAALLVGSGQLSEVACLGIECGNSPFDNATVRRKEGFVDYLSEYSPETVVHNELIYPYDTELTTRVLDLFFARHPRVKHVVTF